MASHTRVQALAFILVAVACDDSASPRLTEVTRAGTIVPASDVGSLPTGVSVGHDGAANVSIPLWVAPGRAGMEPELELTYSSRSQNGMLGVGWALSVTSSINRCPTSANDSRRPFQPPRAVQLDAGDAFCLDGRRLVHKASSSLCSGGQEYVTRPDDFVRVVACGGDDAGPAHFIVQQPDGVTHEYGATTDSVVDKFTLTLRQRARIAWFRSKSSDRNGNTISYEYLRVGETSGGSTVDIRPEAIIYSGGPAIIGNRKILFGYDEEPRADAIASSVRGIFTRMSGLLESVTVTVDDVAIRRYDLGYERSPTTGRHRLTRVQTCPLPGSCLPATRFAYSEDIEFAAGEFVAWSAPIEGEVGPSFFARHADDGALHLADFSGDGRDDLLYWGEDNHLYLRLSNGNGFGPPQRQDQIRLAVVGIPPMLIHDIDGNGSVDLETIACVEGPFGGEICRPRAIGWNEAGAIVNPSTGALTPLADPIRLPAMWGQFLGMEANYVNLSPFNNFDAVLGYDAEGHPQGFHLRGADPQDPDSAPYTSYLKMTEVDPEETYFRDLDGDGHLELLFPYRRNGEDSYIASTVYRTSTGVGIEARARDVDLTIANRCQLWADFDADGYTDYVQLNPDNNSFSVRLFSGERFGNPVPLLDLPATRACGEGGVDAGIRVVDYNGDGLRDILFLGKTTDALEHAKVWINRGGRATKTITNLPLYSPDWRQLYGATSHTIDIDGDGHFDIFQLDSENHFVLLRQIPRPPDLLVRVTDGMGDNTSLAYGYVTGRDFSQVVVTTETIERGGSNHTARNHSYGNGTVSKTGREFIGFEVHDVHDPRNDMRERTTFDLSDTDLNGYRTHPFASIPKSVVRYVWLGSKWHVTSESNHLCVYPEDDPAPGVDPSQRVCLEVPEDGMLTHFAYAGGKRYTTFESATFDIATFDPEAPVPAGDIVTHGSAVTTAIDEHGNVRASTTRRGDGAVEDYVIENLNDATAWHLRPITRLVITSKAPGFADETRTTEWRYDDRGNLTDIIREPNALGTSLYQRTGLRRSGPGIVTEIIASPNDRDDGADVRRTTIQFTDPQWIVPSSIVNPLGHTTSMVIDGRYGVPLSVTDPNLQTTSYEHDSLGRPKRVDRPDGTWETWSYERFLGMGDVMVIHSNSDRRTNSVIYDDAGRVSAAIRRRFDGGSTVTLFNYDLLDRPIEQVRLDQEFNPTATSWAAYDQLGRPLKMGEDLARWTTFVYDRGTSSRTDEDGVRTDSVYDAAGRLARSVIYPDGPPDQPPHPAGQATQYKYGPFEQLRSVTDPYGNPVTMEYDRAGRQTVLDDADLGRRESEYSSFDEVTIERSPRGNLQHAYDKLGRPVSRTSITDPETNAVWVYDVGEGAKGRLSGSYNSRVARIRGYDVTGRLIDDAWYVDGSNMHLAYSYDSQGRVSRVRYPNIEGRYVAFDNVYNESGFLTEVREATLGWTIWRAVEVNDAYDIVREELNLGYVRTEYTYDPRRDWLESIQTWTAGSLEQHAEYEYTGAGRLNVQRDHIAGTEQTFGYDPVGRLESVQDASGSRSYEYDDIGNLVKAIGEPSFAGCTWRYGEGTPGPHAVTSIACSNGTHALGYDANGNLISIPAIGSALAGRTIVFDQSDQPRTITKGGKTFELTYDADGVRVLRRDMSSGARVDYVGGRFEQRSDGNGLHTNVYTVLAGERPVAQLYWHFNQNTTTATEEWRFLHLDRLGTPQLVSDGAAPVERPVFDVWGQREGQPSAMRIGFTGHPQEDDVGAIDMGGRMYDPVLKRFWSADPFVQDPGYGPSWNRYSYVFNDPLNRRDPTGFQSEPLNGGSTIVGCDPMNPKCGSERTPFAGSELFLWTLSGGVNEAPAPRPLVITNGEHSPSPGAVKRPRVNSPDPVGRMVNGVTAMVLRDHLRLQLLLTPFMVSAQILSSIENETPIERFFGVATTVADVGLQIVWKPYAFIRGIIDAVVAISDGDYERLAMVAVETVTVKGAGKLFGLGISKVGKAGKLAKYTVGEHKFLRKYAAEGLDSHHVGQKAPMKKLVKNYDQETAPAILVPKRGHTIRQATKGVVSRSTKKIPSARDLVSRDIRELRRMYPDMPARKLRELIQLNKAKYPEIRKIPNRE